MNNQGDTAVQAPELRRCDADGLSPEARAVIARHGLDRGRVMEEADRYEAKEGTDFNRAPVRDFWGAPLGHNLAKMMYSEPSFDPFRDRFAEALDSLDYGTSDDIMAGCLEDGIIVDSIGRDLYDSWKEDSESLEGFNVALARATGGAARLRRFVCNPCGLDDHLRGRWLEDGNAQNLVRMTVGASSPLFGEAAVAVVSYRAKSLEGWVQPVRYSPYPRTLHVWRERFGDEKGGNLAGEGEVHVHVGCPIPPRRDVGISLLPRCGMGRQEAIERYGGIGTIE